MGEVIGDINSRRGLVEELADRSGMKTVAAKVPLAEMFQYVSTLRSMTKGRAQYSMKFDSYALVPPNVEKEISEKYLTKSASLAARDQEGDAVSASTLAFTFYSFVASCGILF